MKKPKRMDQWERTVKKRTQDAAGFCYIVDPTDAAALLRREHRAVVRMVQNQVINKPVSAFGEGYNMAIDDVLAKLKAREES